jgi:hypothetical protein
VLQAAWMTEWTASSWPKRSSICIYCSMKHMTPRTETLFSASSRSRIIASLRTRNRGEQKMIRSWRALFSSIQDTKTRTIVEVGGCSARTTKGAGPQLQYPRSLLETGRCRRRHGGSINAYTNRSPCLQRKDIYSCWIRICRQSLLLNCLGQQVPYRWTSCA